MDGVEQEKPIRILIVDDEKSIRLTTSLILGRAGYATACAEDGRRALELASEFHPHVALLDVMLPGGCNGIEVCRRMREYADAPRVVMMTAVADKQIVMAAANAGAESYIVKPFSAAALLEKLMKLLASKPTAPAGAVPPPETSSSTLRLRRSKDHAQFRLNSRGSGLAATILKTRDGRS